MTDAESQIHNIRTGVDAFVNSMTSDVRERVRVVMGAVLNRKAGRIPYDQSLVECCGADSLDFVDIIYRLEDEFGIELPVDCIQDAVRRDLEGSFEADGQLSVPALERLRVLMPEADQGRIAPGLTTGEIPELFTTETFVRLVGWRLLERISSSAR